jgi:hypothetical protein
VRAHAEKIENRRQSLRAKPKETPPPDVIAKVIAKSKKASTGTAKKTTAANRPCKRCGGLGHYAKTCKRTLDETLDEYDVRP